MQVIPLHGSKHDQTAGGLKGAMTTIAKVFERSHTIEWTLSIFQDITDIHRLKLERYLNQT
tara:strand:- start:94 stop:276 length:183 start_codon:yes stop_codon:yes gene_type:complete